MSETPQPQPPPQQQPPPAKGKGPGTGTIVASILGAFSLGALLTFGAILLMLGAILDACSEGLDFTKGRLLRIDGRARLPRRRRGEGWKEDLQLDVSDVPVLDRVVLGELWHLAARMEHASIPAFSKLSLQLAGLGAPDELLTRCHEAAIDEIDHARRCFAVASAFLDQPLTAGPIPELLGARAPVAARSREESLTHLALASLVDGCLSEGVAAEAARRAAERATNPGIKAVLEVISRDEFVHAALAADVVAFCCEAGGKPVRDAVAAERARLSQRERPSTDPLWVVSEQRLTRHGLLSQHELQDVFAQTVRQLTAEAPRAAAA